jgi:hypothetical protein
MATEPNDHTFPEKSPVTPGDMTPSKETPTFPSQKQVPNNDEVDPYKGEVEDEDDDPVGKLPRL